MEETKEKILLSAEKLIAQMGASDTTIAKIAADAGIADSLVYQYFKGKDDLLFSIAYRKLKVVLEMVEDQLQGIIDPISRLGKLIWYSLNYHDKNPDYAAIVMFECHSKKNFYDTPAYQLHQQFFTKVHEILMHGVQTGIFRNDVDMTIVKEIITGLIGSEILDKLNGSIGQKNSDDLKDIMTLILPMILADDRETAEQDKQDRILSSAEKVFSQSGFSRAKISDIAKQAKVAEGTIYEYFKSKEDLLLSIPMKRLENYLKTLPDTFIVSNPVHKLQRFFKNHFELFLSDTNFLRVFLIHILLNPRFYGTPSHKIYSKYVHELDRIIEEGKSDGSFREHISTRIFRNMFLGAFNYIVIRWLVTDEGQAYDKMIEVRNLVDLLTQAIIPSEKAKKAESILS